MDTYISWNYRMTNLRGVSKLTFGFLLAGLLAVGNLLVAHAPMAMGEEVPPDVETQFDDEALSIIRDAQLTVRELPNQSGDTSNVVGFGDIFRINHWSPEFLNETSSDQPVVSLDEWVAPYLNQKGEALGLYRVWRPTPDALSEFAGLNFNAELANSVLSLSTDATLIEDPMAGGYYVLKDGFIIALNETASKEVPRPMSPAELMPIVAERVAFSVSASEGIDGAAGGGGPVADQRPFFQRIDNLSLISVILIAGGAGGAFWVLRIARRHQKATQ